MTRSAVGVFGADVGIPTLYLTDEEIFGPIARIVSFDPSDMTFVDEYGTWGVGNNQFKEPEGIDTDNTYLYIADYDNRRIVKRLASDFSYVTKNDLAYTPWGICTDGTYVYVSDLGFQIIYKYNASDMTYTGVWGGFDGKGKYGMSTDNTYVYAGMDFNGLEKRDNLTLTLQASIGNHSRYTCTDGTHVYCTDDANDKIVKRLCSDLSFVSQIGTTGGGDDNFIRPQGICMDGTHLYIADQGNDRIVKRLASDLSYVDEFNDSGSEPSSGFQDIHGICIAIP